MPLKLSRRLRRCCPSPRARARVGHAREDRWRELQQVRPAGPPRRSFFGIAAVSPLGLFGFATATAHAQAAPSDGPDWPGSLKGRHKQLFDVYTINAGFPLGFVNNFLTPNESATAVMIFRHQGLPYALNSMIWAKYKVGETFKIIDPETKGPAVKNPWFEPKPAVVGNPQATLDHLATRVAV